MNVAALLEELQGRGIRIWADGDRLRCNAPTAELTTELRDQLAQRKQDILEFLRSAAELGSRQRAIVPLQPEGTRLPIFGVAGHNGDVFCYRFLARHLGRDQPFYGLQPPGLDVRSEPLERIEELAGYFASQVRAFRRGAPCVIAGFCAGGAVAFELAQQLRRGGSDVAYVALFGAPYPARYRRLVLIRDRVDEQVRRVRVHLAALARGSFAEKRDYLVHKLAARKERLQAKAPTEPEQVLALRERLERTTVRALGRYQPMPFAGRVCLFLPNPAWTKTRNEPLRWKELARESDVHFGPEDCTSDNMLRQKHAPLFAELYAAYARGANR
jgi:thioesterase domain-containing protein